MRVCAWGVCVCVEMEGGGEGERSKGLCLLRRQNVCRWQHQRRLINTPPTLSLHKILSSISIQRMHVPQLSPPKKERERDREKIGMLHT